MTHCTFAESGCKKEGVMNFLWVFLGAGLGGALRHGVNLLALRHLPQGFPWGTLAINVLGSLAMGLVAGVFAARVDASQGLRLFLATGVLGGFTTFSAFSLEVMLLHERGATAQALLYAVASVLLAVGGLAAGLWLMRQYGAASP